MRSLVPILGVTFVTLIVSMGTGGEGAVHCKDERGVNVDWWIMYKLPHIHDDVEPHKAGFGYAYMDSNGGSLKVSSKWLNASDVAMTHTLQQVYEGDVDNVGYVMWNDETPDEHKTTTHAHSKGVLSIDTDEDGFWLIHTVPRFPPYRGDGYGYREDAAIYGQTFLCLSLDRETINDVGKQLLYYWPKIYDSRIPDSLQPKVPDLMRVLSGERNEDEGDAGTSVMHMSTVGGFDFVSLAKNRVWGLDVFEDLIAPYYDADFLTETWIRRPGLDSYCRPEKEYEIMNIHEVKLDGVPSFPETKDHSKWGISVDPEKGITCLGGLNRMTSQRTRGGGFVCFSDGTVYESFQQSIYAADTCGGRMYEGVGV